MSWGISSIGKPDAVADEVSKVNGMPTSLQTAVKDFAEQLKDKDVEMVVESSGHVEFNANPPYGPRGTATLSIKFQPPAKLPQG